MGGVHAGLHLEHERAEGCVDPARVAVDVDGGGRGRRKLDQEGVVQVLRSDLRGDQAPVLAAVGPMQFEVAEQRMATEFNAPVRMERLDYSVARRTRTEDVVELNSVRGVEVLTRSDGELLALFPDKWRVQSVQRAQPDLMLETLVAGHG